MELIRSKMLSLLLTEYYFCSCRIAFLGVATWLGCSKSLGHGYRALRTLLVLFAAFHYIALYIYQLDYSQEFIPPESLHARLVEKKLYCLLILRPI